MIASPIFITAAACLHRTSDLTSLAPFQVVVNDRQSSDIHLPYAFASYFHSLFFKFISLFIHIVKYGHH